MVTKENGKCPVPITVMDLSPAGLLGGGVPACSGLQQRECLALWPGPGGPPAHLHGRAAPEQPPLGSLWPTQLAESDCAHLLQLTVEGARENSEVLSSHDAVGDPQGQQTLSPLPVTLGFSRIVLLQAQVTRVRSWDSLHSCVNQD